MSSVASSRAKEFGLTFDVVSVVMLFDPSQAFNVSMGAEEIEELEKKLGGPMRTTEGLGVALNLAVPRYQLELATIPGRFEVKSQNPDFSQEIAERMFTFLTSVAGKSAIDSWRSVGHNFIVSLTSPKEPAIKYISRKLLSQGLARKLSQDVIGGTASLWMEVDGSTLLLRFEPQRQSTTTRNFTANANFSVSISDKQFPTEAMTVDRMAKYCRRLVSILEGLGL